MNGEERLRRLLGSVDEIPAQPTPPFGEFLRRARRRRAVHRTGIVMAVAALLVLGAVGGRALLISAEEGTEPVERPAFPKPPRTLELAETCGEAKPYALGDEGAIAYLSGRRVSVHDVELGESHALTGRGATLSTSAGISVSPSGRWVIAGPNALVPTMGGTACAPLGEGVAFLSWIPGSDRLIATTLGGGLVTGTPAGDLQRVFPGDAGGSGDYTVNEAGTRVALSVTKRARRNREQASLVVVDLATGDRRNIYTTPRGTLLDVAAWSPDGDWVLAWTPPQSQSLAADGAPLVAISVQERNVVTLTEAMLPYEDFLTWCGNAATFADGFDRVVTTGKRLAQALPPDWEPTTMGAADDVSSMLQPDCAPRATTVAAVVTADGPEEEFGRANRDIVVLRGGSVSSPATPRRAEESPSWAPDGTRLLLVKRPLRPDVPGQLWIAGADGRLVAPLANLAPPMPSNYGHIDWGLAFDWFQPID